jgi:hypothetical protein
LGIGDFVDGIDAVDGVWDFVDEIDINEVLEFLDVTKVNPVPFRPITTLGPFAIASSWQLLIPPLETTGTCLSFGRLS